MQKVAFICGENTCLSSIAAALGKFLAGSLMKCSAIGEEVSCEKYEGLVRYMRDLYNIDMRAYDCQQPIGALSEVDIVVLINEDREPAITYRYVEKWNVVVGTTEEEKIEVIRNIERHVLSLAERVEAGVFQ